MEKYSGDFNCDPNLTLVFSWTKYGHHKLCIEIYWVSSNEKPTEMHENVYWKRSVKRQKRSIFFIEEDRLYLDMIFFHFSFIFWFKYAY